MMWSNATDADGFAQAHDELSLTSYTALTTLADAAYFVILAAALMGAHGFARGRDGRSGLVLFTAVGLMLMPIILFGDPRYKVPAVPLLAILAAPTIVAAWRGVTARDPRDDPLAAPPSA